MTVPPSAVHEYEAAARSTDTFGRVMATCREHHFIVDGPVQNGCPGEEVTPAELFLAAVASCGVELLHVIARDQGVPLRRTAVKAWGRVDRGAQAHPDLTTFNAVRLSFTMQGADSAQAAALIEGFKRR
jgi:organic hydroperoxide reductase OsmC/OhrA